MKLSRAEIIVLQQSKEINLSCTKPLPQILAIAKLAEGIARNLALNLYRDAGFDNMAQAYGSRNPLGLRSLRLFKRKDQLTTKP